VNALLGWSRAPRARAGAPERVGSGLRAGAAPACPRAPGGEGGEGGEGEGGGREGRREGGRGRAGVGVREGAPCAAVGAAAAGAEGGGSAGALVMFALSPWGHPAEPLLGNPRGNGKQD
jgi:hypothetical protein